MKAENQVGHEEVSEHDSCIDENPLLPLVVGRTTKAHADAPPMGIVVGTLVGLNDHELVPLVRYPGQQGTAAIVARTTVDVRGAYIGKQVLLVFEADDAARPIVVGVLRDSDACAPEAGTAEVQVDADGERVIVRAKRQLVLICGEASITLTAAGKVIIRGKYVSSHAAGVNRVTGGSIQLN